MEEYLDNELADNDEDTRKMKKAKKDVQKKIAEARATKMAKNRASFSKVLRPVGRGSLFPNEHGYPGFFNPYLTSTAGMTRGVPMSGQFRRSGTWFSCGKAGHWRSECPLLAVAHTPGGEKLSDFRMNITNSEFILHDDVINDVDVCRDGECNVESEQFASEKGYCFETEHLLGDTVRGRL